MSGLDHPLPVTSSANIDSTTCAVGMTWTSPSQARYLSRVLDIFIHLHPGYVFLDILLHLRLTMLKTGLFCLFYECHVCHPIAQAKNLAFILFFSPPYHPHLSVPKFFCDISYLSLNFTHC